MTLGMELGLSPGDFVLDGNPAPPPKFLAHVYYSYCDFVRTLRNAQSLLVYSGSSSSSSFSILCILFLQKSLSLIVLVLSLFQYKYAMHSCTTYSADSGSRSCELVAF